MPGTWHRTGSVCRSARRMPRSGPGPLEMVKESPANRPLPQSPQSQHRFHWHYWPSSQAGVTILVTSHTWR